MPKINLPVILLRGIIVLPNNEIRLEFDNDISKNIIDLSEMFHDSKVLLVSQIDHLEQTPSVKNLPSVGVIAKISKKMELPNGNTRVLVTGLKRAVINEYLNLNRSNEILESIVTPEENFIIDKEKELVLVKKIYHELEHYVKSVPYISNSILSIIIDIKSLKKLTDIVVPNLNVGKNRFKQYLEQLNPVLRAEMILEDIYKEQEMFRIEREIDLKVKESIDKSQKEFLLKEKSRLIKEELGEISVKEEDIENIKNILNTKRFPKHIKLKIENELRRYESITSQTPELDNIRNYIEWLITLPYNKKTKDLEDLVKVKKSLDETHYGLDDIKTRVLEYLAIKKNTKSLKSPILCLVGPPGTGKTSLAFSIANAINRNFVKISVGGVGDESEIKGHRRTYIGAKPGRIIEALKKAKTSNPVFLIDEIDKMTKSYTGDPASSLLEVLDPEQNKYFSDNYIEEEIDLSNIMFIATANYINDIPHALKDRLEIIDLSGYTEYEKLALAKNHLIKKAENSCGVKNKVSIPDDILLTIIRQYTKESGVRQLERVIEKLIRKIVADKIIKNKSITKTIVDKKILRESLGIAVYEFSNSNKNEVGVVTGLAYTYFGGDTLAIEVNYFKGNGNLVLTGSLGEVMKESANIALSYIKANHKALKIDYELLTTNDIHIHMPEGAVPKDGPSAGITITTALISMFTNKKIPDNLSMTGEITLRGDILKIGGLKEKSIAALRSGIKKIIIPYDNVGELDELPKEIKKEIKFISVKNYSEVVKIINKKE